MDFLSIISIMWIAEGIANIRGSEWGIPQGFKGHDWTKEYTKKIGLAILIMGVSWFILDLFSSAFTTYTRLIILVIIAIPIIIYVFVTSKKYKKLINND